MIFLKFVGIGMITIAIVSTILNFAKSNEIKRYQQMLIDLVVGALYGAWGSVAYVGISKHLVFILVLWFIMMWLTTRFQMSAYRYFIEVNNY